MPIPNFLAIHQAGVVNLSLKTTNVNGSWWYEKPEHHHSWVHPTITIVGDDEYLSVHHDEMHAGPALTSLKPHS